MKIKVLFLLLLCFNLLSAFGKDILIFGNRASEQKHALQDSLTETYVGGLEETARRMLPGDAPKWCGGLMRFRMKVDAEKQNYFTVRCWGSESDNAMVMLFIERKQVGYRHLGDYDLLHRGNGEKPCLGRFYYYTVPLPLKYTQGKKEVELEMRSYGNTWDYGDTFGKYQKNMETPTIGFYKAYIGTEPCFVPDRKEKQGMLDISQAPVRKAPGIEVFARLKEVLSARINQIMAKDAPLGQQEIWLLADARSVKWTPVYQSAQVVDKVAKGIDDHYRKYLKDPKIIHTDGSVYNGDWMTTCLLARSIRTLWSELNGRMDVFVAENVTRKEAWAELFLNSATLLKL